MPILNMGPDGIKEKEESLMSHVIFPDVSKQTLTTTPFPHDGLHILKVEAKTNPHFKVVFCQVFLLQGEK